MEVHNNQTVRYLKFTGKFYLVLHTDARFSKFLISLLMRRPWNPADVIMI